MQARVQECQTGDTDFLGRGLLSKVFQGEQRILQGEGRIMTVNTGGSVWGEMRGG